MWCSELQQTAWIYLTGLQNEHNIVDVLQQRRENFHYGHKNDLSCVDLNNSTITALKSCLNFSSALLRVKNAQNAVRVIYAYRKNI